MNRRGFLAAILAAGVAPAVVKAANLMPVFVRREAAGLLVPATQLDALYGYEGNALLTISQITKEALLLFEKNLLFIGTINKEFDSSGLELSLRKPRRYDFN